MSKSESHYRYPSHGTAHIFQSDSSLSQYRSQYRLSRNQNWTPFHRTLSFPGRSMSQTYQPSTQTHTYISTPLKRAFHDNSLCPKPTNGLISSNNKVNQNLDFITFTPFLFQTNMVSTRRSQTDKHRNLEVGDKVEVSVPRERQRVILSSLSAAKHYSIMIAMMAHRVFISFHIVVIL